MSYLRKTQSQPESHGVASGQEAILADVPGIGLRGLPPNVRFITAEGLVKKALGSKGSQKVEPVNVVFLMPGCPYCKSLFPEVIGAAWIAFCMADAKAPARPFYIVSSSTTEDWPQDKYVRFREVFGIEGFPTVLKIDETSRMTKHQGERNVISLLRFFEPGEAHRPVAQAVHTPPPLRLSTPKPSGVSSKIRSSTRRPRAH